MAVVHLVYRPHRPWQPPPRWAAPPANWLIRSACADRDGRAIAGLAEAARGPEGPSPRAPGLLAELSGRDGRHVEAWLAMPPQQSDGPAFGFVSLTTAGSPLRFSLGWLLVHPAARRQGIGRTLVATACAHAAQAGAEQVWVETRRDWTGSLAFWRAVGFRHETAGMIDNGYRTIDPWPPEPQP